MRKEKDNRVLGRLGARELTPEEVKTAKDGRRSAQHTNVITWDPFTGSLDGDGA